MTSVAKDGIRHYNQMLLLSDGDMALLSIIHVLVYGGGGEGGNIHKNGELFYGENGKTHE